MSTPIIKGPMQSSKQHRRLTAIYEDLKILEGTKSRELVEQRHDSKVMPCMSVLEF